MMRGPRKRTLVQRPRAAVPAVPPAPPEPPKPFAVVDMGASAIRLVVAEGSPGQPPKLLEEASRGVQLGKDTFTHGRLGAPTIEAALRTLEGFRRIMDTYGVVRYRAVATSAVREAQNRDTFLDRVKLRTGIEVEVIDGSEENRLTYMAVRERLKGHECLAEDAALMLDIGGGSADLSLLQKGEPIHSGTFALGSIRLRQNLLAWNVVHEQRMRLLRRHIHNVAEDIRREMPLKEARSIIALGGEARFAAAHITGEELPAQGFVELSREAFLAFSDEVMALDDEQVVERYQLSPVDAETLVPALAAYRELISGTAASRIVVPDASLRAGLVLDLGRSEQGLGIESFRKQVLASAAALGERYHYDAAHARQVAFLATRLFDELRAEHGLSDRDRLLLEVAALLHDVGIHVNLKGHHKHSQYILSVSEIFGLSREDMAVVSNVARYHRRATPQKSHLPYMALDRETRVAVNKMAAVLRVANALESDHLQKVKDVKVGLADDGWVLEVEAAGDLTMERLAAVARSDFMTEVFGRRVSVREAGSRP